MEKRVVLEKQKNYILAMPKTDEIVFQGDHVKYFMGLPYIAIFENYPAATTRIWICKATERDFETDKRVCVLAVRKSYNEHKKIGFYIKLCEAQTEAEVNEKIETYQQGDLIFRKVFGDAK